jgi:hypothetical protein
VLRALALTLLLLPWAAEGAVTATDVAEIRAVINRQIGFCPRFHPASVQFLGLTVMGADAVQRVHLTDGAGTVWMAYYALQRQRDGSWRASGCHLVQPGRTIPT